MISPFDPSPLLYQGSIRLAGGSSRNEGRIEVKVNGVWGTVCDDLWDINDASVACRQLGFPSATSARGSAQFGLGSGPIFLDNVRCVGDEDSLLQCSHSGLGTHDCLHTEDAGVVCKTAGERQREGEREKKTLILSFLFPKFCSKIRIGCRMSNVSYYDNATKPVANIIIIYFLAA